MRINELLFESITFSPAVKLTDNDREYWGTDPWDVEQDVDCWHCDGTGKLYGDEESNDPCIACRGTGKRKTQVSTAPSLNVSNTNGLAIQEFLGLDPDYSGLIPHNKLPELMRILIKAKNQGANSLVKSDEIIPGRRHIWNDDGVTHIRTGPTIHHGGRSQQQVERYIDRLIEIVRFAQKNNAAINWS